MSKASSVVASVTQQTALPRPLKLTSLLLLLLLLKQSVCQLWLYKLSWHVTQLCH